MFVFLETTVSPMEKENFKNHCFRSNYLKNSVAGVTPCWVQGGLPRAPVFPENRTCFLKSIFKSCRCFRSAGCSLALRFFVLAGSYFILGKSTGRIPPAPHTLLQSREICPYSWDLTSLHDSSVPWTFASVSPFLSHSADLLTHGFSLASSFPWNLVDAFLQLGWPNPSQTCPGSRNKGMFCLDIQSETGTASELCTGNN